MESLLNIEIFLLLFSLIIFLIVLLVIKIRQHSIFIKNIDDILEHISEEKLDIKLSADSKDKITSIFAKLERIKNKCSIEQTELQKQKKYFEDIIYKKNVDLKIALEKEEKANNIKNEFLSNISHEIRTPMNGIVGTINLLEDTELSKKQKEYVEAINISVKHLLRLIKDSLDISKIESGTLSIEQTPFNLKEMLQHIINNQKFNKNPDVNFKFAWDDTCNSYVVSDMWILDQIINNLLNNAFKFTSEGTVKLTVKNIGSKDNKSGYFIAIEDTGIGIEEKYQETIFKKFNQIDNTMFRETSGPGLGLAIASNLAKALGCKINVESSIGEGSKFWFNVFLEKADEQMIIDLKVKEANNIKINCDISGKLALVAEDDRINSMVIEDLLQRYGFKVVLSENGYGAIEEFSKRNFDIVFMDCRMPKLDGYKTTEALREMEKQKQKEPTPIIALTANALKDDEKKCIESGMNYYISKPIDERLLIEILEKCFKKEHV